MTPLAIILVSLAVALAGPWYLADTESGAEPSGLTREEPPPAPRRAIPQLDTAGNQEVLEAAPHRGRLVAWSGSIWRAR